MLVFKQQFTFFQVCCSIKKHFFFSKKVNIFQNLMPFFLVLCKIEHFWGNKILIFKLDFEKKKKWRHENQTLKQINGGLHH